MRSFHGLIESTRFYRIFPKESAAGVPRIEVTFDIDTDSILKVSMRDLDTGMSQSIRNNEFISDEEIRSAIE